MDAEQILSLAFGGAIAALGLTLFARLRGGAAPGGAAPGTFLVSYLLAGMFIALWPARTCLWLDRVTGVAGLGLFLWACATTLCLGLQITFHCQINDRWPWWIRATRPLAVGVIAVYAGLWGLVLLTARHTASRLFYDGYRGDHAAVLVWNLTLGVSISLVSALAAREQLRVAYPSRDALTLGVVYVAGVLYGLMITGQALASRLGYGSTTVVPIQHAMRLPAVVLATGCAVWTVVGADLWPMAHLWLRTRRLRRQWDQLAFLLVILSERLVWRYAAEDAASLAQLARQVARLARSKRAGRHVLIALQAARRITWRRGTLIPAGWANASPEDQALADYSVAAEAAHDIATGGTPVSDIGQVIRLFLADVTLPTGLIDRLPEPTTDHTAAAALLARYPWGARVPLAATNITPPRPPTGLPSPSRRKWPTRRMHAWYSAITARHAQAETDLVVCCELVEDYFQQLNAPDDDDLGVKAWTLGATRELSPLQREIAQRTAQILGLFDIHGIQDRRRVRDSMARRKAARAMARSQSESRVVVWCAVAASIGAVLEPSRVPTDVATDVATWRGHLDHNSRPIAALIQAAARELRERGAKVRVDPHNRLIG